MSRLILAALFAALALNARALAGDVIFYAPFENSLDAAVAAGSTKATYNGKPTFVKGAKGQGVELTHERISFSTRNNLDVQQGTVTFWIEPKTAWKSVKTHNWFFTAGDWVNTGNILVYWLMEPDNKMTFLMGKSSASYSSITSPAREWPAEQWYFIAATWDKTGAIKLYVDGKPVAESQVGAANRPVDVGETMSVGTEVATAMDELTIYGRPLTAEEILAKYSEFLKDLPKGAADVEKETLVAHYTFDEGQGTVAKDSSAYGNDGQIHNAVYVPSPRGHALQFNGKDSYVDCGSNPILNIRGDMTFEAWVKVALDTPPDNWNEKFLFGDNAGLTVSRDFIVTTNNMRLMLQHGNGTASEDFLSEGKVFDGSWQHVAVVCEFPTYYMFVNGRQVATGEMNLPITPTAMTPHRIGGWFWENGFFKGEMDEIKVYNRALPEKAIREHAGLAAQAADVSIQKVVSAVHYPRQEMVIKVFCQQVQADRQSVIVNLFKNGGKTVLSKVEPIKETRPGSGRALVEVVFDTKGLDPAGYMVQAMIKDAEGRIAAEAPAQSVLYPEKPEWFGSQVGIGDKVLPPYTPIQVDRKGDIASVRMWGRSYDIAPGLFLSGIRSQEKDLLTGPMRLMAKADGKALSFSTTAPSVDAGPAKTTLTQTSTADAVKVSIKTTVEYDGFVRMDMALNALRPMTMESLTVEIPLDARSARYLVLMSHLGHLSGSTPNGLMTKKQYDLSFQPTIWLGDEEKGLSWFAESSENWYPAAAGQAIQILRDEKVVTFRLNLIGQAVKMDPAKPLAYTFGLQATPLKPIKEDAWDNRIYELCRGPYGNGTDNTLFLRVTDQVLDDLAAKGIKTVLAFEQWTNLHNYPRTLY